MAVLLAALPEMGRAQIEDQQLIGADAVALRGFGDDLVSGKKAVVEPLRDESSEFDSPAANLLAERNYRHRRHPKRERFPRSNLRSPRGERQTTPRWNRRAATARIWLLKESRSDAGANDFALADAEIPRGRRD